MSKIQTDFDRRSALLLGILGAVSPYRTRAPGAQNSPMLPRGRARGGDSLIFGRRAPLVPKGLRRPKISRKTRYKHTGPGYSAKRPRGQRLLRRSSMFGFSMA